MAENNEGKKPGNKRRPARQRRENAESLLPGHDRVALVGFRGIGKSAIARELAEMWHINRVSLDTRIESVEGKPIDQIVRDKSWAYFREREESLLKEVAETPGPVILDAGGGVVEGPDAKLSENKIKLLSENFFCIYITMDENRLLKRLTDLPKSGHRPALPGQAGNPESSDTLLEILKKREPGYLKAAHAVVDITGTTVKEAAARIARLVRADKKSTG